MATRGSYVHKQILKHADCISDHGQIGSMLKVSMHRYGISIGPIGVWDAPPPPPQVTSSGKVRV